jgi:hypothetical protein
MGEVPILREVNFTPPRTPLIVFKGGWGVKDIGGEFERGEKLSGGERSGLRRLLVTL